MDVPVDNPVISPEGDTDATAGLLLLQVPPAGEPTHVVVAPPHKNVVAPAIAGALTLTTFVVMQPEVVV
jgi:hypothetical protein